MATKTTKKNEAIPAQPAPAAPVELEEETREGYAAWLGLRPAIEARAQSAKAAGLPQIAARYDVVARRLRERMALITPALPAILKDLSPDKAREAKAAAGQVLTLAYAARFVAGQLEVSSGVAHTTDTKRRAADREELRTSRAQALRYLGMMETLQHVSEQEADQIRSGKGLLDAARDVERIGLLLKQHWADLAPALALVKDKSAALTLDKVNRMIQLGGAVATEIKGESSGLPDTLGVVWKTQRLGVGHLLNDQWNTLRHAAIFHFNTSGQTESADSLHAIKGLQR